jgi:hypothetical protein
MIHFDIVAMNRTIVRPVTRGWSKAGGDGSGSISSDERNVAVSISGLRAVRDEMLWQP